ncbi:hypothetical protein M2R77_21530, partial [Klebsiella pneumoniae]|nr:hypothetical protein [Klebsiella pneumoniae]MDZ0296438.1 hypothetical protein [Klebsiella pneumoniae]
MNAVTEQRKVLLEIADLKVHFDIKDGKQWFWQPSKTLKAVDGVTLGTVAKLAMRQPFVLFKGLTFQKLCLPGAFR